MIAEAVGGRHWLHAGQGWQFFATDPLVTRLCSVLQAEPGVYQFGINLADASALTGIAAPAASSRTAVSVGSSTLDEVLCIKVS